MKNPNLGRFYSLRWSSHWNRSVPWSLSGQPAPYVGHIVSHVNSAVSMFTLGPLALVMIEIKAPVPKPTLHQQELPS